MSVFLAYHYPCLDGAYSLLMSFLFFRETQKKGISVQDFIDYISPYDNYQNIDKSIYEHVDSHKASQGTEESKNEYNPEEYNEYSPMVIKDVVYVPTRLNANGTFYFPFNKYSSDFLKKSVLIFMDYNGINAGTIVDVTSKFLKLIVIDHHLTFEHVLTELQEADVSLKYTLWLMMTFVVCSQEFNVPLQEGEVRCNLSIRIL